MNSDTNENQVDGPARPPAGPEPDAPVLNRIGPDIFAIPMGLFGAAHVLHQLSRTLGAPFELAATATFMISGAIFIMVLLLYAARAVRVSGGFQADYADPARMVFGAVFAIALTLGARGLALYSLPGGQELLLAGGGVSFLVAVLVVRQWFTTALEPASITPLWFVPVAGTLVATKALYDGGFETFGLLMGGLGFFGWMMVLPLIVRRLIIEPELPPRLIPTLFILIAPPGLAANAALTLLPEPIAMPVAMACLGFGLFFLGVLATLFRKFEKAPWSMAWWAITFPTAAMASAALSIAAASDGPATMLIAHGLAGLNITATLGVAVMAIKHVRT